MVNLYNRVLEDYKGRIEAIRDVYFDDTLNDDEKKAKLGADVYEKVVEIESEIQHKLERDAAYSEWTEGFDYPYRGSDMETLLKKEYMSLIIPDIIEEYTKEFNEAGDQIALYEALREMGYQGDYGKLSGIKDAMEKIVDARVKERTPREIKGKHEKETAKKIEELAAEFDEEIFELQADKAGLQARNKELKKTNEELELKITAFEEKIRTLKENHEKEISDLKTEHRTEMENFKKEVMDRVDRWMKDVVETVKGMPVIGKLAARRVEKRAKGIPAPEDR